MTGIRAAAALTLALALTGCAGGSDEGQRSESRDWQTEMNELERVVEGAGVTCAKWDEADQTVAGDRTIIAGCDDAAGSPIVTLLPALDGSVEQLVVNMMRGDKCITVDMMDLGTPPAVPPSTWFIWNAWAVGVHPNAVSSLEPLLTGPGYTIHDAYPGGLTPDPAIFPDCDPSKYGLPEAAEADQTPTAAATPEATSTSEPCVEHCTWSVADVIADLDGILCKSQDENAALQDDITDKDTLHTGADKILVCANGGTNDLSGLGVVYLWRDYADMGPGLAELSSCRGPGVTVSGGNDGNPGYAVANIQTGQQVVDWLKEGGAEVLCD